MTSVSAFQMFAVFALAAHTANSHISFEANESDLKERIIGGRPATDGQFPYAVALYSNGRFICTASLISPTTVLTAAHCVVSSSGRLGDVETFYGMVGAADRRNGKRINFSSVTPHPQYNRPQQLANDIAYFRTTTPVQLDANTGIICIAKPATGIDEYGNATAMGWGSTSRLPVSPNNLQYAEQKLLPHLLCMLRYPGSVTQKHLCADGFGTGICYGDSGGPLAYRSGNQSDIELGVASFVRRFPGCGSIGTSPGVFTRVAAYSEWILQSTGDNQICTA